MKLLLRYGSDYKAKNVFGDDALQTAALRGYTGIVRHILDNTEQTPTDAIHSLELLGANLVDEIHNISGAIDIWRKAMTLRFLDPQNIIAKEIPINTVYAYQHAKEPQNLDELNKLSEADDVYMQALLIRERILGPNHNLWVDVSRSCICRQPSISALCRPVDVCIHVET